MRPWQRGHRGGERRLAHQSPVQQHVGARQGTAHLDVGQARLGGLQVHRDFDPHAARDHQLAPHWQISRGHARDHVRSGCHAKGRSQRGVADLQPIDLDGCRHIGLDVHRSDALGLLILHRARPRNLLRLERPCVLQHLVQRFHRLDRPVHGRVDQSDVEQHQPIRDKGVGPIELGQRPAVVAVLEQVQAAGKAFAGLGPGRIVRGGISCSERGPGHEHAEQSQANRTPRSSHQNGFS